MTWDLLVVGAGPAGAAAALAARRARPAARVLLLDRAAFPRDKTCGDAIAPEGVDELTALGAGGAVAGHRPVGRLRISAPGGPVVAAAPRRPNLVIRRSVFDARLADAATAAGAQLARERVITVHDRGDHVLVNGSHRARVVVAADGVHSVVRRRLGVPANPDHALAVAVRAYAPDPPGPPEQRVDMLAEAWPAYAWSFPLGDGWANVGYGLLRSRLDGGRQALHGVLSRLEPDADAATFRAAHLPLSSARPSPGAGRVLLAGDAASLVNPLTGEGIYYALLSGRLAGEAAVEAPHAAAAAYTAALRRRLASHHRHTTVLARAVRHRRLADAAVAAAASPGVMDTLVALGLASGTMNTGTLARVAGAYLRRVLER